MVSAQNSASFQFNIFIWLPAMQMSRFLILVPSLEAVSFFWFVYKDNLSWSESLFFWPHSSSFFFFFQFLLFKCILYIKHINNIEYFENQIIHKNLFNFYIHILLYPKNIINEYLTLSITEDTIMLNTKLFQNIQNILWPLSIVKEHRILKMNY